MSKAIGALLILSGFGLGFGFGVSYGLGIAIEKGIYAAHILFDIELSDNARNLAIRFPQLLSKLSLDEQSKLGLNSSQIKEYELAKLNRTMTAAYEYKYPRLK
jgi:hypothetical protein